MSFNLGPKGGLQDPAILSLLAELTVLVETHGPTSKDVIEFIEVNRDITFVDQHSQHMHTFKEVAEVIVLLVQGLHNRDADNVPGDGWQSGKAEQIFEEKDPTEPADWWKL